MGAVALLLLSAVPLALPGQTETGARMSLLAVHVVAFAVVAVGLLHSLDRKSRLAVRR